MEFKLDRYSLAGLIIGLILGQLIAQIIIIPSIESFVIPKQEVEPELEQEPVINLSCPEPVCPEVVLRTEGVQCKASCSTEVKVFEACHIPESVLERGRGETSYTGYSNIPSIFAGNTLKIVETKTPYPGCFYAYWDKGEFKVHRLLGAYEDYWAFKGDNVKAIERVQKEDIEFLVSGIRFT